MHLPATVMAEERERVQPLTLSSGLMGTTVLILLDIVGGPIALYMLVTAYLFV